MNFLPVIEPHPPTLGGIEVFYRYASPTEPPQAALAYNDCSWRDLTAGVHWPGTPFAPYTACADTAPTLYLGFDAPLPAERIGVFLRLPGRPGSPARSTSAARRSTVPRSARSSSRTAPAV